MGAAPPNEKFTIMAVVNGSLRSRFVRLRPGSGR
jgi:hypothetical protein